MTDFYVCKASDDGRTNVWQVSCDCGRKFSPTTTMYSRQVFDCPKCGVTYHADWNKPSVEVVA